MPIPVTPKPLYPNVPNVAGVPPLMRPSVAQIFPTVALLAADVPSVLSGLGILQGPQWGLFTQGGAPAFAAVSSGIASILPSFLGGSPGQSIGDVEYRVDHRIATAPQEQGAFLSYNKVSTPFTGRVTYIVSGGEAQIGAFLGQVQTLQAGINFLTLVMPEISYPSCDIVHHDYRRSSSRGLTMLSVDIWVEQIRVSGTAAFSNAQQPSGAGQQNYGTVQGQTPTAQQSTAFPASGQTVTGPTTPSTGPTDAPVTTPSPGTGGPNGVGGGGAPATIGQPSEPYYDDNNNQIGVAPSTTPADGPIVGSYKNGQPVIGGAWQSGFTDTNGNFVKP